MLNPLKLSNDGKVEVGTVIALHFYQIISYQTAANINNVNTYIL